MIFLLEYFLVALELPDADASSLISIHASEAPFVTCNDHTISITRLHVHETISSQDLGEATDGLTFREIFQHN